MPWPPRRALCARDSWAASTSACAEPLSFPSRPVTTKCTFYTRTLPDPPSPSTSTSDSCSTSDSTSASTRTVTTTREKPQESTRILDGLGWGGQFLIQCYFLTTCLLHLLHVYYCLLLSASFYYSRVTLYLVPLTCSYLSLLAYYLLLCSTMFVNTFYYFSIKLDQVQGSS